MTGSANGGSKRPKGSIETLPSGALRVCVYAGVDPISKKRHNLTETIPAPGSSKAERREADKLAEQALRRLLNEVDEKRNPRTKATVNQLIDRWLKVARIEGSTRRGYLTKINKHIKPLLGSLPVGKVDAEMLDSFYAELARCRDHCDGKPYVARHWTKMKHSCRANANDPKQRCRWHECAGLADSSVRQIHWVLSGAFDRAVRWKWIAVNPTAQADPPGMPQPDPNPPTAEQAATIVNHAFETDLDWGTFVWVAMTTGARRGEMCALRWDRLNLADADTAMMSVRTAIALDDRRRWYEKPTKTHQQRRIALDPETVEVLREHKARAEARAETIEEKLTDDAFVFSYGPDSRTWIIPDTVTQRYERMTSKLGIGTTLHSLRHYSATELITAGVDPRTVGGRLGHSGGGATTLKVYSAWVAESDQRAARTLSARMPRRRNHGEHGTASK